MLVGLVAKIGENMSLRRSARLSVNDGVVASYLHNMAADGMGKIGVLVALESTGDKARLNDLGRKVAMHVASAKPLAATTAELDPAVVEKEKQILTAQAAESGKPANVIEKMVEGRIRKFYQESVLVEQAFVMDPGRHRRRLHREARQGIRHAGETERFRALRSRRRHREGRIRLCGGSRLLRPAESVKPLRNPQFRG